MVLPYIQMEINMKENGKIISNMEKELLHIAQGGGMKANGLMGNLMG